MSTNRFTDVELPDKPRGRPGDRYYNQVASFAESLRTFDESVDQKVSARGYAYLLENENLITKSQIDYAENLINKIRKNDFSDSAPWEHALLPTDFTAKDDARRWYAGDDGSDYEDVDDYVRRRLRAVLKGWGFDRSFWEYQDHFLQVVVEKIDLVHLFRPICERYNIPITTGKGWSTINQRAEIAARFAHWAEKDKQGVLLYCGDFDPPGRRISDYFRKNLNDLSDALIPDVDGDGYFYGGRYGDAIIVDRFGLNHDFVKEHDLTWVDNLETGSGRDLCSPSHPDHDKDYVQDWLRTHGCRKVEANALVAHPEAGQALFEDTVAEYLGDDPLSEYEADLEDDREAISDRLDELGVGDPMRSALDDLE